MHGIDGHRAVAAVRIGLLAALTLSLSVDLAQAAASTWSGPAAYAAIKAARHLRARGCPGGSSQRVGLTESAALDLAAERWAGGLPLHQAVEHSFYRGSQSVGLHVRGPADALEATLSTHFCARLTEARLSDIGVARHGSDSWIILAEPFEPPSARAAPTVAAELLRRINDARAQPRRCGRRVFAAAPPLRLDERLTQAAHGHAGDMIERDYFAHVSPTGVSPAQRVAATGYRYRLVGENIAQGPPSAAEAVAGWLASPEHCENIMDPRFSATGIAFASNERGRPRVDWVQDFAAPL